MSTATVPTELTGKQGTIALHHWAPEEPARFAVVLAHGYGEHAARYEHVAQALVGARGAVLAPDHAGHGRSEGERALVTDLELLVDDLEQVRDLAATTYPGVPLVLIGHSMGGIVATRLAQRDPSAFKALVLSGPAIGGNPAIRGMLAMDPLPEVPIDPSILSRDESVGAAYMADDLVYHGPFDRRTLEAMFGACDAILEGPSFGSLPTIWVHGSDDGLAPVDATRVAIDHLRGDVLEEHIYPEARHEVFNETNQDEVIGDVMTFLRGQLRPAH